MRKYSPSLVDTLQGILIFISVSARLARNVALYQKYAESFPKRQQHNSNHRETKERESLWKKTLSVILAAYLPCVVDIPELPPDVEKAVLTFRYQFIR